MIKYLLLTAMAASFTAGAVEKTLTWNAPTTYVNGDPLPAYHITGYRLLFSHAPDGGEQVVTGTTATFTTTPGNQCAIIQTIATNGLKSRFAVWCGDVVPDSAPSSVCE